MFVRLAVPPVLHVPVARPVVVSWLGSDAPVASSTRGPASCRAAPGEVNHPQVDLALSGAPECLSYREEFDDSLVWFYGYPGNGRQLFPPHILLYNKYFGRKLSEDVDGLAYVSISLRNIRVGQLAVVGGLHVGGASRFVTRTFVQNLGGRKTNTRPSFVRVDNGHHDGRNYFALGCKLHPPFSD